MAPRFTDRYVLNDMTFVYEVEIAPYIDAHDVRVRIPVGMAHRHVVRDLGETIADLIAGAAGRGVTRRVLVDDHEQYVLNVRVPRQESTRVYAASAEERLKSRLRAYTTLPVPRP